MAFVFLQHENNSDTKRPSGKRRHNRNERRFCKKRSY
jgi:hypothetical protein